ncbi:MAG TPA: hypothetical protein PLB34_12435 [Rhodoblastus sp.]|nr:hypothetical protein [Rhodoblastus sp.]
MTAQIKRSVTRLRSAGVILGVSAWTLLVCLCATKLMFDAPRDGALLLALGIVIALLVTGATLILVHALRTGFGALDSFFVAALARSAQRREAATPPRTPPRRGVIGDRPFVENADGSVVVDTLLGPRLFPSLADAQDFVGS